MSDPWSRWVLGRRDAGDPSRREATLLALAPVRDRVLAAAEPLEGATLLDVGTGDGLVGLAALERVGHEGTVIFSDVSEALLAHAREEVAGRGLLERARFVVAGAEDLAAIPDASVDVVTTRSVLMYVRDKAAAFRALRRVLRAGGRISLFEPINRLMFPEPPGRFWGYDVTEVADLAARVTAEMEARQRPAADPLRDFDDRDLARLAVEAGFAGVHVECHIDVEPGSLLNSDTLDGFLDTAPNPLAPTLREAVDAALDADERGRFLAHLARAIAQDAPVKRSAVAYVAAQVSAATSR